MNAPPIAPAPPPDLLFVLLPDSGAAPDSLDPLATALLGQYPGAATLALHPPLAGGRWWPGEASPEGVATAVGLLVGRIRFEATRLGLDWPRVALAGVGDGALLALEAVQAEPALAGRVLAFAGSPLARPQVAPQQVSIHLLHGRLDERFPYPHVVDAAQALVALGADVTADVLPGLGHGLHPALIDKALEQLRTFIPARLWREAVAAAAQQQQ